MSGRFFSRFQKLPIRLLAGFFASTRKQIDEALVGEL
jgi:hypothetical protein